MKVLKKLICLLMVIVSLGTISACSKNDDVTNDQPEKNQGGGNNGTQEVYVSYTASEIMSVGSEFVYDFFDAVEEGGFDESVEDLNLLKMKVLFLNASKMLEEISEFEDLENGYTKIGNELVLLESDGPNSVKRFYYWFGAEDENGNSNVKIRIIFGYNGDQNAAYSYDFYEFLIQTNKKSNTISCDISIERSLISGENDSTGKYFCAELDGDIGSGNNAKYHCYQFERTEMIAENEQANFNNVMNFEQSKFDGVTEIQLRGSAATKALQTPNSEQSELVGVVVGNLGQRKRMMTKGGHMGLLEGASERLVEYVNFDVQII